MEGDLVTGTNSFKRPRLNSVEFRSQLNINNPKSLCKFNFKCSNLVKPLSINSVCKSLTLWHNDTSLHKYNEVLKSYTVSTINNTNSDNSVTIGNLFQRQNNTSIVRNDGILDPNKHNSSTFATNRIPSSLPHLNFNEYSSNILPCTKLNNNSSIPFTSYPWINVISSTKIVEEQICKSV